MARVFITGSADGLGHLAAAALITAGHQVVLHARNDQRAQDALNRLPGAEAVVTADLSSIEETRQLASQVNALGTFDAVVHNAGVYQASAEDIFTVNTLAPYILTCLIHKPSRLVYLSSGMHMQGRPNLENFTSPTKSISYSDSKLHVLMLCLEVASRWTSTYANAVDPGWVPTKMGGESATDDLQKGYETQVWLAVSNDAKAMVSGKYFFHQREDRHNREADDRSLREKFLGLCAEITGVPFPPTSFEFVG
jgi:NAD(P)-dependent dehydrogenase (short-subunit alcohol dehydrogenase family)